MRRKDCAFPASRLAKHLVGSDNCLNPPRIPTNRKTSPKQMPYPLSHYGEHNAGRSGVCKAWKNKQIYKLRSSIYKRKVSKHKPVQTLDNSTSDKYILGGVLFVAGIRQVNTRPRHQGESTSRRMARVRNPSHSNPLHDQHFRNGCRSQPIASKRSFFAGTCSHWPGRLYREDYLLAYPTRRFGFQFHKGKQLIFQCKHI